MISFVIITDGKKYDKIRLQIKSILNMNILDKEIIISGQIDDWMREISSPNVKLVDAKHYAEIGSLGGLRNAACEVSGGDFFVISDDDMVFTPDWYSQFQNYEQKNKDWDILTSLVRQPNNDLYWGGKNCYKCPKYEHAILNDNEESDCLYASGGQSFIIRKSVFDKVRWDDSILIYTMKDSKDYKEGLLNEDVKFSQDCLLAGFKIKHNSKMTVYHNDSNYTNVGRYIYRRVNGNGPVWVEKLNLPQSIMKQIAILLLNNNLIAEAADILRKIKDEDFLNKLHQMLGGKLEYSNFTFNNYEYINLIQSLDKVKI